MAEAKNHNEAGEVAPSTVEKQAPDVSEENAPSTSEPVATSIPSANAPDPTTANPETNPNAAVDKSEKKPAAKKAAKAADGEAGAPAAKPKKEKAPAVEDKPFAEFVQQDYLPALKKGLAAQGIQDVALSFEKQKIPIVGFANEPDCWQIVGRWNSGWHQPRQFNLYFFKEDIQGTRGFSYSESGGKPSTLEPFLIDERKVSLDLLVFGVIQRLNGQKWLVRN